MHDPNTRAFTWPKYDSWLHKRFGTLVEIWHVDPCTDGSDDSCGWSQVKLTGKLRGLLDFEAGCEARHPWYQREMAKQPQSVADTEHLLRGAILEVAHIVGVKCDYPRACKIAARLLHNSVDNVRGSLCFAPGYHSNSRTDDVGDRKQHAFGLLTCIARYLLTDARPWWRKPRWHVKHWRVEFPFIGKAIGKTLGRTGDYA